MPCLFPQYHFLFGIVTLDFFQPVGVQRNLDIAAVTPQPDMYAISAQQNPQPLEEAD